MTARGWRLVRVRNGDGALRVGAIAPDVPDQLTLLDDEDPVALLESGRLAERAASAQDTIAVLDPERLTLAEGWQLGIPLDAPEVWAAGVTYERSRDARLEESQTEARDAYSLVYEAERPEIFLKDAAGRRTVGSGERIGVRSDASWSVPEPELGLVIGRDGALLAATIGNDVSSRDIEGANPLYLPQAKVYAGACALGPALLVPDDWSTPFEIEVRILAGDGGVVFEGATSTARMKRTFEELVGYVMRDNPQQPGTVLLTGTGVVPPDEISLEAGQTVEIHIGGIGTLVNPVAVASELV